MASLITHFSCHPLLKGKNTLYVIRQWVNITYAPRRITLDDHHIHDSAVRQICHTHIEPGDPARLLQPEGALRVISTRIVVSVIVFQPCCKLINAVEIARIRHNRKLVNKVCTATQSTSIVFRRSAGLIKESLTLTESGVTIGRQSTGFIEEFVTLYMLSVVIEKNHPTNDKDNRQNNSSDLVSHRYVSHCYLPLFAQVLVSFFNLALPELQGNW
jgi:hypothetical protein